MVQYECTLDDATREYLESELGETDETREKALAEIKQWLSENPSLNANAEDHAILPFLRGCKFRIERTKQKLSNYYVMKTERPEWFSNRDPDLPELRELAKLGTFVPLRKFQDNRLVVIIRTAVHDPKKHDIDDVFKIGKMLLDVAAKQSENPGIFGVTAVFDMNNMSLGHARQMTPAVIKKAVYAWRNYHCRAKHLEFINAPLYVNVVLRIFQRFMSAKMKSRVKVHFRGVGGLYDVVDKENLPMEYGGTDCSIKETIGYWCDELLAHKGWFKENEKFKAVL